MTRSDRPSPDAFLRAARQEARGRLKIFLGAAPGVGKTCEMLLEGAEMMRQGHDVVIGLVETHGRVETQALVTPLEVIPRHIIQHGAHRLPEFDLDGLLARRPQIALIDELAHSNAAGSRHPKRWQDIAELRDAGIDVLTTLNIQHIESLNDVVAGFTHVRVRETVPDSILDDAEIEVVDLPPDELISRLREGKVYAPEEAGRALGHFFSKANLSALRELALRRAAQTVDRQMLDHVSLTGDVGIWAAGERIIVAVNGRSGDELLVRTAKRLSDAFHVTWSVVTVETPRCERLTAATRARLSDALTLASGLGATMINVPATHALDGLISYARAIRATTLIIGKSRWRWCNALGQRSMVDRLVTALPGVAIHVVAMPGTEPSGLFSIPRGQWRGTWTGLTMVVCATLVFWLLRPIVGANAIDMLYLIPILVTATRCGLRPALAASLAAACLYNFFFLPPLYTLNIQDPKNLLTFLMLAGVGGIASRLAGGLRDRAAVGARMASENAAIAAFGQRLASVSDEVETAQIVCEEIGALLNVSTLLMTMEEQSLRLIFAVPTAPDLSPIDLAAAEWALSRGEMGGRNSATLSAADWQFHPLKASLGIAAALGIFSTADHSPVSPDKHLFFNILLGQAALALGRLRMPLPSMAAPSATTSLSTSMGPSKKFDGDNLA